MINVKEILDNKKFFFELVEKELELSEGALSSNTTLKNLEEWDSLAIMTFVTLLDSKFKININTDQLSKCKKPTDLYLFVKNKVKNKKNN